MSLLWTAEKSHQRLKFWLKLGLIPAPNLGHYFSTFFRSFWIINSSLQSRIDYYCSYFFFQILLKKKILVGRSSWVEEGFCHKSLLICIFIIVVVCHEIWQGVEPYIVAPILSFLPRRMILWNQRSLLMRILFWQPYTWLQAVAHCSLIL